MAALFGLKASSLTRSEPTSQVQPPARPAAGRAPLTTEQSVGIPGTFRAMQILATAGGQLSLDALRGGVRLDYTPSILRKPCLSLTRRKWVEQLILQLAADGNAFIHKQRANGEIVNLPLWPSRKVHVGEDEDHTPHYDYEGKRYYADEVTHIGMLWLPGMLRALGPIQAARAGLTFARDARDHMARWFDDTGQPPGILTTDSPLTNEDARTARRLWNGLNADGTRIEDVENPSRIKVLGKGLKYESSLISPQDALWLDAQNWNLHETAVAFGMPTTLMLVGYEGASRTYNNSNEEWLAFIRFTLMWYLGAIEDALTDVLVRGQEARFNVEALLRADTKARYESHNLALAGGWRTPAEVRRIEGEAPHPAVPDEPRPAATLTSKDQTNA